MKLIKTNNYPLKGFRAITHYPIGVFYKGSISAKTINHEAIHWQQQKELWIIPFYIIYGIEFLFKGYRDISFEREAYDNESNKNYLSTRPLFGMWRKSNK